MFACLRAHRIVEAKISNCLNICNACLCFKSIFSNITLIQPIDTHQTNDREVENVGNNHGNRPNPTMSGRGGAAGGRGSWFWRILPPLSPNCALLVRRPVAYTPRASRKKPARDQPGVAGHAQSRVPTRQTQSKSQLRCREGRPTYRQR